MSDINPGFTPAIWLEILKNLPAKTLGKCICVCKSWKSLISTPFFVAAHIKNYSQIENNSLLLYRQFTNAPEQREQYTLFLDSVQKESNLEPRHTFTCPFATSHSGTFFRVVGSANGLICLSDDLFGYTYLVILWNPLVHKYIRLLLPRTTCYAQGSHISAFGFGYDSKKESHKVVRLTYMRKGKEPMDKTPPIVELYSVQEGKWRSVSAKSVVNICICDFWWSQCFLNWNVHWVAWERDAETLVFHRICLLLFDVEEEKFKKMPLPEALTQKCTLNLCVSEYGGKLSMLHSVLKGGPSGNEMTCCEIWVKKEYSVRNSWCKMVSIETNSNAGLGWVQCLRKNGDVLGFGKKGELVAYDPLMKQTKRLGLRGCWRSWFTCPYTESLALFDIKNGVGTYDEARGPRQKKFEFKLLSNGILDMEEQEADSDNKKEDEKSADLGRSIYHQGKCLVLEQLLKFDGGRVSKDPLEFMSMAGISMPDFMSMAE